MSATEVTTSAFETSTLTFSAFNKWLYENRGASIEEINKRIRECIARTPNGYIIREHNKEGNFRYQALSKSDARAIFDSPITWSTDTEIRCSAKTTKTTRKTIEKSLYAYINNPATSPSLQYYNGLTLLTDDPTMLCDYVPPQGEYDDAFAAKLIEFMRSRVKNKRAFDEEISSHAYRLRHPDAFIEKCFIHHCTDGNSGKSFMAGMLAKMYPRLANVGVQHQQLTEQFNGWAQDYLMIHVEELQGTEYADKNFARVIKQMTTRNTSSRKLYKDTVVGENHAIVGLNTNQADLYGLTDPKDPALVSRLVILQFEKPLTPQQWREEKRKLLICEDEPEYSANYKKIGASLYHYLKDEHGYTIVEGYNPSRYYEAEKEDVIRDLKQVAGSLPERFMSSIGKEGDEAYQAEYRVFTLYFDKRSKDHTPKRVSASRKRLISAWECFMAGRKGSQAKYAFDKSVEPLLILAGFKEKRLTEGLVWYSEDIPKFNDWYDHRAKIETVDMKDYAAIGEDKNEESDDDDDKCGNYVIQLTAARAEIERLKKDNIRLARAVDSLKAELAAATEELEELP